MQKISGFPNFKDCGSLDNQMYKDNITFVGFIAISQSVAIELKKVADLFQGVVEITGSELKIEETDKGMPNLGVYAVMRPKPGVYYLLDGIKIIKEK